METKSFKHIVAGLLLFGVVIMPIFGENTVEKEEEKTVKMKFRVVLAPRHKTVISAEVASIVKEIPKEMGDAFRTGDVLLLLDDLLFVAAKKKAKFLLERAEEQLSARKQLFEDNVSSAFELKDAEAVSASAELDFIAAEDNLRSCTIKAPYQGHIEKVLVGLYELVQPGQPIIEIVNDKTLLAKLLVPSFYFDKVHAGQTIKIHIKETGQDVKGIITHIGAVIDPASSMIKIFSEVNNHDGSLRAGMTGITRLKH